MDNNSININPQNEHHPLALTQWPQKMTITFDVGNQVLT